MTAWKNSLEGWCGLAFYSKYAVGRIWKLTADSGKGLTDTLFVSTAQRFPDWRQANPPFYEPTLSAATCRFPAR
jgi:hypothetical protein